MPTRAEIQDVLATSQQAVAAFFQGLSPEDLERPCTASGVPDAAPWRAKDHFAHQTQNERGILTLLRLVRTGDTEVPGAPGALSPEDRLAMANQRNQAYVDAHRDDSMELLTADLAATRQETLDLLAQFSDGELAAPASHSAVAGRPIGDLFAANARHAAMHISWVEEGLGQGGQGLLTPDRLDG